jgi:dUTP pyrophosphatase
MANVKVRGFKKLHEGAILPRRSTSQSAGYDLTTVHDVQLYAGEWKLVKTGLTAYMLPDEMLLITPRSGLALKHGLTITNSPGIVDADYTPNEIGVILYNASEDTLYYKAGERIAQAVFTKYLVADDDQAEGERTGGFGHTGV